MYVKSAPGTRCPYEGYNGRTKSIPDSVAVEVPNESYYRRLVKEGSLIKCEAPVPPKKKTKGGSK